MGERIDFHAPYLCARSRRAGEDDVRCGERGRGAAARRFATRTRGETVAGDVESARHDGGESFGERESYDSDSSLGRASTLPSNALNTHAALTLYLLIVSVITARTVALTLIKVQLNKTKTENNHFCLTGKMARYVAEAVTTHAPLAKHMFFRPEFCAGLMHRAGGAAPRDKRSKLRVMRRTRANCE